MNNALLKTIENYTPSEAEQTHYDKIVQLVKNKERCCWRDCIPAHITGSSLLMNKSGDKVLLNHHKFLDIWIQFGGHADGNPDILNVAQRELEEESGIMDYQLIGNGIFDVDTHFIPANNRKSEPSHEHFDIRYLFQCTTNDNYKISDESVDMKWCSYEEAIKLIHPEDQSVLRMLNKWKNWRKNNK